MHCSVLAALRELARVEPGLHPASLMDTNADVSVNPCLLKVKLAPGHGPAASRQPPVHPGHHSAHEPRPVGSYLIADTSRKNAQSGVVREIVAVCGGVGDVCFLKLVTCQSNSSKPRHV